MDCLICDDDDVSFQLFVALKNDYVCLDFRSLSILITSHIRQILIIIIIQLLHKDYALFNWNPVPWVPGVTGTFLFVGLGVDDYFALSGQGVC